MLGLGLRLGPTGLGLEPSGLGLGPTGLELGLRLSGLDCITECDTNRKSNSASRCVFTLGNIPAKLHHNPS